MLTDLQPVKIQLNNSVRSAFPTPSGTHTHVVQTHTRDGLAAVWFMDCDCCMWGTCFHSDSWVVSRSTFCVSILFVFLLPPPPPQLLPALCCGLRSSLIVRISAPPDSHFRKYLTSSFSSPGTETTTSRLRGLLYASSHVFSLFNFTPECLTAAATAAALVCALFVSSRRWHHHVSFQMAGHHGTEITNISALTWVQTRWRRF